MSAEDHARQSAATLAAVQAMEDALGRSETDMTPYFHEDFAWRGNRGCGTKLGLQQFQDNEGEGLVDVQPVCTTARVATYSVWRS